MIIQPSMTDVAEMLNNVYRVYATVDVSKEIERNKRKYIQDFVKKGSKMRHPKTTIRQVENGFIMKKHALNEYEIDVEFVYEHFMDLIKALESLFMMTAKQECEEKQYSECEKMQ